MKVILAILLASIALAHAQVVYNPGPLFGRANTFQHNVTVLQEDILVTITNLRVQLSGILKRTSNKTLSQIEDNIWTVFEMDKPVRELIFITHNTSTACILNLRVQLNAVTEFSGFESSVCLGRYDRSVMSLITDAYGTLAEYEAKIVIIQMLVVDAFNGLNVWTQPEDIENRFITEFNTQNAAWQAIRQDIGRFLATLETDILTHNNVLQTCFDDIQDNLVPQYAQIVRNVAVCTEFDA